jgi:hypothetical protein
MMAARQIAFGKAAGKKWENPYITDGLIIMLDGKWNIGGGRFDNTATKWIDLSGNGNDVDVDLTQASWEDGFLKVTGTTCTRDEEITNIATLEVLFIDSNLMTYPNNKGSYFVLGEMKGPSCLWYKHLAAGAKRNYTAFTDNGSVYRDLLASRSFTYAPKAYYVNGTSKSIYGPPNGLDDAIGCKAVAVAPNYIEIYHIRAYSRALTDYEIEHNYNIDKQRFGL